MFGQGLDVVLRAADVRARFGIAPFGQACHSNNGGFLRQRKLAGAFAHQIIEVVAVAFVSELIGHPVAYQRGSERLDNIVLRAQ